MTFSSTPLWRSCTLRRARGHSCGKLAYRLCFTYFRVVHGALHGSAASYLAAFKRSCQVSKMRHFPAHFRRRCLSPFRLPSRSTSCVLGLFSVVICVTGSIVPHARKEVTNWEDHSPHSRDVQHTDSEDSVMPLASFQKEARGIAPPFPPPEGEAQRQQILNSTTDTAHHREQSKTCCAKANEGGGKAGMMRPIHAGPREPLENR